MISNSKPWDNLKFDEEGIKEVLRKFFGTLSNTYNFFALYANIDGFIKHRKDQDINPISLQQSNKYLDRLAEEKDELNMKRAFGLVKRDIEVEKSKAPSPATSLLAFPFPVMMALLRFSGFPPAP